MLPSRRSRLLAVPAPLSTPPTFMVPPSLRALAMEAPLPQQAPPRPLLAAAALPQRAHHRGLAPALLAPKPPGGRVLPPGVARPTRRPRRLLPLCQPLPLASLASPRSVLLSQPMALLSSPSRFPPMGHPGLLPPMQPGSPLFLLSALGLRSTPTRLRSPPATPSIRWPRSLRNSSDLLSKLPKQPRASKT